MKNNKKESLYKKALKIIDKEGWLDTPDLQRRLKVGCLTASELVDLLCERDVFAKFNEKVNALASAEVHSLEELTKKAFGAGKDLYRTLVKKLGRPTRVMFKLERRRGKDVVVGGELQFKSTNIFTEGAIVGEEKIAVKGKRTGGCEYCISPDVDSQLVSAIVKMFATLYEK